MFDHHASLAHSVKRPGGGLGNLLGKIGKKPKIGTLVSESVFVTAAWRRVMFHFILTMLTVRIAIPLQKALDRIANGDFIARGPTTGHGNPCFLTVNLLKDVHNNYGEKKCAYLGSFKCCAMPWEMGGCSVQAISALRRCTAPL